MGGRYEEALQLDGSAYGEPPAYLQLLDKEEAMQRLLWGLFLLVLLPGLGLAQTGQASWDNLRRLGVGEKIEVVDMKLKSFRGTFVSFSPEAISLRVGSDEVAVQRADVLRVTSRERTRRGRNALIGLAIGAAGGLATGLGIMEREPGYAGAVAGTTILGAVVGAGLGAPFPGYQTIYRVKRSRGSTSP